MLLTKFNIANYEINSSSLGQHHHSVDMDKQIEKERKLERLNKQKT